MSRSFWFYRLINTYTDIMIPSDGRGKSASSPFNHSMNLPIHHRQFNPQNSILAARCVSFHFPRTFKTLRELERLDRRALNDVFHGKFFVNSRYKKLLENRYKNLTHIDRRYM